MKKTVVLDIDNCLADFEGEFCRKFGWKHRGFEKLEYRYPDMREEIEWFVQSPSTYRNLDVIELGVKIARFCENEGFEIHVVSSRPESTITDTCAWLKQNKIPFHYLSVENGSKLGRIERIAPVFAVDDLLRVVYGCSNMGIPSFLIAHPWNKREVLDGSIHRIRTFDEFLGKFTTYFD